MPESTGRAPGPWLRLVLNFLDTMTDFRSPERHRREVEGALDSGLDGLGLRSS